jgi:hypothetical protein
VSATSDNPSLAARADHDPDALRIEQLRLLLSDVLGDRVKHRIEVETLGRGAGGDWFWAKGTQSSTWTPEDQRRVKRRARIVTDWVEVDP